MTGTVAIVLFHSVISVVAILSGFRVIAGQMRGVQHAPGTRTFLASAIATSATGFVIPFQALLGTHYAAGLGIAVLLLMVLALYGFGNRGFWRAVYLLGLLFSMYLLVFAGVAQAFLKIPPLHPMAPLLNEWPFVGAEIAALILFVACGIMMFRARPSTAS